MTDSTRPPNLVALGSVGAAVRAIAACLCQAGIEMPKLEAQLLVGAAVGLDRQALWRDAHMPLRAAVADTLEAWVGRRLAHEPVARIVGYAEFHGLNLAINRCVLDPRNDTETVVNVVLAAAKNRPAPRILDLGTGSGALLCALLSHYPGAFGVGVDRSAAAAAVAQSNLTRLRLNDRAVIIVGDWGRALGQPFDIVVANPPYVESDVIATLDPEVRDFDPPLALDGGPDGLQAYREIFDHLPLLLRSDAVAAFEIGETQAFAVANLVKSAGLEVVTIARDLSGHERVVVGQPRKLLGVEGETV
jgi:release factor glutamine methyltransferase